MPKKWVVNASPVIVLAKIYHLFLLQHLAEDLVVPAGVAEVLESVTFPTRIFAGGSGELLAVREIQPGRHLVVVYREGAADGFIITAFITSKIAALERRKQLWS